MTAISVVMGVYNGSATLPETLDSILTQTEREFELVVVDDGSTDATPEVLAAYAARDPRIQILTQQNTGLTRALIAGCAAARGTYIARHDAGDLSHPRRLAEQKRLLDADPTILFVSCATQYCGPKLEPLWIAHPSGAALSPERIIDLTGSTHLTDGPTHHGSVMFRRDAYERAGGYRAAFYYGQDFDLWYRLAQQGKFQTIDETLYTARVTPDSITAAARERQEAIATLSWEALLVRMRGESDAEILKRVVAIARAPQNALCRRAAGLYFVGEMLRQNGDRRASRYLLQSISACPLLIRAWVRYLQSLLLWLRPMRNDE